MPDFHHAASVVLVTDDGRFILQKRDNIPGIRNPGMITLWGGALENGETPSQGAVREVSEETSLRPTEADLEYLGDYPRDYKIDGKQVINHVFFLRDVDDKNVEVYEGEGTFVVDPEDKPDNPLLTDLSIDIINDYRRGKTDLKA